MFSKKNKGYSDELEKKINSYDIAFEAVFDDIDTRECFRDHLKRIYNCEPYNFLCDLQKYITLIGPKSRYCAAKKIVAEYIADNADHCVNVGWKLKQNILRQFALCNENNCPINLFDEVGLCVYVELKQDCFPSFIRSECFQDYVNKKLKSNPEFLKELGAPKAYVDAEELDDKIEQAEISNLGVLYDPNKIEATDADFDRLLTDIRDKDMWKPVFQSDLRSVFVSKSPYYSGKKGLKKMFECGVLNCTVDEAFNAYADHEQLLKIEKEIRNITIIDYHEGPRFAHVILRLQYKLPFPLKNRDFCLLHSVRKEPNGDITMIRKSVNHPALPVTKQYVRGVVSGGIAFQKIDDTHTMYSQSYFIDFGGHFPAIMFNKVIEMRDNSWHYAMEKAVEKRRGLGRPVVSNRVIDTLEHFERKSLLFIHNVKI